MQSLINIINRIEFNTALFYGVGIPRLFFDKIKGDKIGIDKFDKCQYPRLWTAPTKRVNIQSKGTSKKFDLIIINDSKRYKDVSSYFSKALKNINEGGKIVLIDSMPKLPIYITDTPANHQDWCGDVYQFVLELISKGGFKVTSFDSGNGMSIIEIDETKQPKEIEISGFEEWYFQRKKLMTN